MGTGPRHADDQDGGPSVCVHGWEDISLIAADTDVTPYDDGAYASSGTFFSGSAAMNAGLANEGEDSRGCGEDPGGVGLRSGASVPLVVKARTRSLSYAEICRATQSWHRRRPADSNRKFHHRPGGISLTARISAGRGHTRTGLVNVQKYYALQDCGTPVNPELALGQIYGGALKTIVTRSTRIWCSTSAAGASMRTCRDYKVPMINDVPEDFKAVLVETNDPFGPFGSKVGLRDRLQRGRSRDCERHS